MTDVPVEVKVEQPVVKHRKVGTKQEVWDGVAERTVGGLRKEHLVLNKSGKACSAKKQEIGKALFQRNREKSMKTTE